MSEQATTESGLVDRRKPRGRSPNYPGISLGTAIDKARKLYESERRHAAPISVVTSIWGYSSPTTGYATVAVAALKKYGLLLDEKADGERLLRLSELAMDILLNPEPREAIQQAALLPPLHKEMWETYGSRLPSFDTLRWMLVKRGFTESGVQDFLRVYRETITFAKLDAGVVKRKRSVVVAVPLRCAGVRQVTNRGSVQWLADTYPPSWRDRGRCHRRAVPTN